MTSDYEALFTCFLAEQMTHAQLEAHMKDDEVFRRWVAKAVADRRRQTGSPDSA